MFQTIKLAKLRLSPINVRTVEDKALGIEPLAADITARGVLQNLLVTPVSKPRGMFEVFDGGRRLRALMLMAERGTIVAEDYDVPVKLLKADNNVLSETSLAANFHQLKLTPAEECRAFQHFLGKAGDIDAVASRFGQNLRVLCKIIAHVIPRVIPLEFSFALIDEANHRYSGGIVVMKEGVAEIQTIDSLLARRGKQRLH